MPEEDVPNQNAPVAEGSGQPTQEPSRSLATESANQPKETPPKEGEQKSIQPWRAQLPEDMRADPYFDKFPKMGDMAKEAMRLNALMGKAVFKPGEGATAEEIAEYRKALGVPEKPEEYDFSGLDEKTPQSKALLDSLRATAAKANLTKEQAKEFAAWAKGVGMQELQKRQSDFQKGYEEGLEFLKNSYSGNLDSAKADISRAYRAFVSPELAELLDQTGIGNNPAMLSLLTRVGKAIKSDSIVFGSPGGDAKKSVAEKFYEKSNMK